MVNGYVVAKWALFEVATWYMDLCDLVTNNNKLTNDHPLPPQGKAT